MKFLFFTLTVIIPTWCFAFTPELEIGNIESNNSSGDFLKISAIQEFNKTTSASLFYESTTRFFFGGDKLSDKQLGIQAAYLHSPKMYTQGRVSFAPDSIFFPKHSVQVIPHYIISSFDTWFGIKNSTYNSGSVIELRTGLLQELPNGLLLGAQFFWVDSSPVATSGHIFGSWAHQFINLRLDYAKGKTLEGDNLVGSFEKSTITLLGKYKNFQLGPKWSIYRGNIRDEDRYSLVIKLINAF